MGFTRSYPFPYHDKNNTPWEDKGFSYLKKPLKFLLKKRNSPHPPRCSYCRRYFGIDREDISIDIEHILPKEKYKEYSFLLKNLTLACKRCNMSIKGTRLDFLEKKRGDIGYGDFLDFDLNNYKFLHPNLEVIDDYIEYSRIETNNGCVLFYKKTPKALNNQRVDFTYQFFRLKELEVDSREIFQEQNLNPEIQGKYYIPDQM